MPIESRKIKDIILITIAVFGPSQGCAPGVLVEDFD
jgi:hypothetical protein